MADHEDKARAAASDSAIGEDHEAESAAEVVRAGNLASMVINGDTIKGKPREKVAPLPPVVFKEKGTAYWMTRLYIAMSVMLKLAISTLDVVSPLHAALMPGHRVLLPLSGLCALCVVAVVDVAANDLTSPRVHLPLLREHRHVTFMLMGLGLMSIVSAISATQGFCLSALMFVVDAAAAVAVAFLDLFARRRKVRMP